MHMVLLVQTPQEKNSVEQFVEQAELKNVTAVVLGPDENVLSVMEKEAGRMNIEIENAAISLPGSQLGMVDKHYQGTEGSQKPNFLIVNNSRIAEIKGSQATLAAITLMMTLATQRRTVMATGFTDAENQDLMKRFERLGIFNFIPVFNILRYIQEFLAGSRLTAFSA